LGSQLAAPTFGPAGHLWATGSAGLKGAVLRLIRRVARPFFRATTNLEDVLDEMMTQQRDYAREMVAATERDVTSLEQRLERSFDVLKDNLDARIDHTADWAGAQMTATAGTLEERQERALHLSHNTVVELTNARLDLQQMQARLNEMARRMTELETRGRTLEKLTLQPGEERATD
jgi:low affinity Fe/Cu permease